MSTPLFCRHCGSRVSEGLRYCPECGSTLSEAAAAPLSTPAVASADAEIPEFLRPQPQAAQPRSRVSRGLLIGTAAVALLGAVVALGWLILRVMQPAGLADGNDDERPLVTNVQAQTRTPAGVASTAALLPTAAAGPTTAATAAALPTALSLPTPLPLPTLLVSTASPTAAPAVFSALPAWDIAASASQTAPAGVDACGNPVSYPAANLLDGNPETAWRVLGDGIGSSIELRLARPYLISEVQLIVGYAKYDPCDRGVDRWPQGYRAAELRIEFGDGSSSNVALRDVREMQAIRLDQPVRSDLIRLTVLNSNPPLVSFPNRYAAVSEISLIGAP
jgi:hypothetical protein